MKKIFLLTCFFLFAIGFLFEMVRQTGVDTIMMALGKVSPFALGAFIVLSLLNFIVFTLRWEAILKTSGDNIPSLYALTQYRLVTYTLSYLIPSAQVGGEPARILLLTKQGVSKHTATSSVVLDKVFELSVSSGFAALALVLLLMKTQNLDQSGGVAVAIILVLLGLFFYLSVFGEGFFTFFFRIFHLRKVSFLKKVGEHIIHTEHEIKKFFRVHLWALLVTILLSLLCFVFMMLEYYIILHSLGIPVTMLQLIIVTALPLIGYLFPSPGALGALEVSQVAAFSLAGIDPTLALPTLIIIRLRDIVFLFLGSMVTYHLGFSFLKGNIKKTAS